MENEIIFTGIINLDKHSFIEYFPKEGQLSKVISTSQDLGGIVNIMGAFHKLDSTVPISVNTLIGAGQDGNTVNKLIKKRFPNVDYSGVKYIGKNPVTLVINSEKTKERTFFFFPGNFDDFDATHIDWENQKGKYFVFQYVFLGNKLNSKHNKYGTYVGEVLYKAKEKGFITCVDMASHNIPNSKYIAESALQYTDICSINEVETESATGINIIGGDQIIESKVIEALHKIRQKGVSKWVVIHTPTVNYGLDCKTGELIKVYSLNIPSSFIVGTVGAGDAFLAGVVHAAYKDLDIKKALELGVATAACSLSASNGTDGILPIKETWDFFNKFKNKTPFKKLN